MAETISDSLVVVDSAGRKVLEFDARFAVLDLGAQGNEGDLRIRGDDGEFKFHFDGGRQLMIVRDSAGRDVLQFDGTNSLLQVGAPGNEGDIFLRDNLGNTSIHLDGGSGDIILRNADCAEEFDSAEAEHPLPGSVVVLNAHGAVSPCVEPYDSKVAGVVSGAGSFRPAIVLGRSGTASRVPVAADGQGVLPGRCHRPACQRRRPAHDLLGPRSRHEGDRAASDGRRTRGQGPAAAVGRRWAGAGPHQPPVAGLHP